MDTSQQIPQKEVELQDAIATLLNDLPRPVQDFLKSPERNQIIAALSQKYNLHVDQAGEFEHALLFMLLGVYSPTQFTEALTKAGIAQENVSGITTDVNTQIFMRLRDAEKNQAAVVPESVPAPIYSPTPPPPVTSEPSVPPAIPPTPPTIAPVQPISVPTPPPLPTIPPIPEAVPVPPLYRAPVVPAQSFVPPPQVPLATPPPYTPPPIARTMAGDMQSLSENAGALPQLPTAVPAPAPYMPPAPALPPPTEIPKPIPPTISTPPVNPRPVLTDYGVDPYRETPE